MSFTLFRYLCLTRLVMYTTSSWSSSHFFKLSGRWFNLKNRFSNFENCLFDSKGNPTFYNKVEIDKYKLEVQRRDDVTTERLKKHWDEIAKINSRFDSDMDMIKKLINKVFKKLKSEMPKLHLRRSGKIDDLIADLLELTLLPFLMRIYLRQAATEFKES